MVRGSPFKISHRDEPLDAGHHYLSPLGIEPGSGIANDEGIWPIAINAADNDQIVLLALKAGPRPLAASQAD